MNNKRYHVRLSIIIVLSLLILLMSACSDKSAENTLYYSDGSKKYVGDLQEGIPNGSGIQYRQNGSIEYEGQWRNGLWNGTGIEYNYNGKLFYEGEFVNGNKHGEGRLYYEDGCIAYEGGFINGEWHGEGILYGGLLYENPGLNWKEGNIKELSKCMGVLPYADKPIKYEGEWMQGVYDGQGTLYFISGGIRYKGEWKDGKRDGEGTEYYEDGSIWFVGEWSNDKEYNGKGYLIIKDTLVEYKMVNGELKTFLDN